MNVLPPEARNEAVKNIGRILKPNGEAIVSTRGVKDVESAKNKVQIKDGYIIGKGDDARFQKGFTATELKNYVQKTLGKNFTVENVKGIGKAAVKIKKLNIPKGFGGVTRQQGTPVIDIQEKLLFNPKQKFSSGGDAMDNEMLSFSELERFRKENDYYHDTDPRNPMNTEGMDLANPEVQKKIIEELNDRKKIDKNLISFFTEKESNFRMFLNFFTKEILRLKLLTSTDTKNVLEVLNEKDDYKYKKAQILLNKTSVDMIDDSIKYIYKMEKKLVESSYNQENSKRFIIAMKQKLQA